MDVSIPLRAVVPSAHGPVLAVRARAGAPLTGRRIAELTHPPVYLKQVATILAELREHGLVHVTGAGRANVYQFNRDHLSADAITPLVTMRERLRDRFKAHAATWTHQPQALVVYGSTARACGSTSSDIDVLGRAPRTHHPPGDTQTLHAAHERGSKASPTVVRVRVGQVSAAEPVRATCRTR